MENITNKYQNDNSYKEIILDSNRSKPRLSDEEYKKLQQNLILYKQGNTEAAMYIIKSFNQFIGKFARFICYGHVPRYRIKNKYNDGTRLKTDEHINMFINLYISAADKEEHPLKSRLFSAMCTKIREIFSVFEYDDIYNQLVCALLSMACKYKITKEGDKYHKENGTFAMYVSKCFHWEARNTLNTLLVDRYVEPINFRFTNEFNNDLEFTEECVEDPSALMAYDDMIKTYDRAIAARDSPMLAIKNENVDVYKDSSFNFNWINGITCSDIFQCLTNMEREILVHIYIERMTLKEVGELYGYSNMTICRYKNSAISRMEEYCKEKGLSFSTGKKEGE